MISESELKKYKEWGLHLIPLKDGEKIPVSKPYWKKNGSGKLERFDSWKWDEDKNYLKFSDEELLEAKRIGINHEACGLIDVDCDDIDGSQFMSEFPDTLTIGDKINGSTFIRKKLYFYDGFTEHKSFGKGLDCGTIIENLAHTQSWCFGDGRIILNNVKPTRLSDDQYKRLKESVREVYALTVLTKLYPKKDTNRDAFSMALTGTLLRETNWTNDQVKEFKTKLCNAVGDNAVRKRLEKVDRFRNNLDDPDKKVWGVKKLTELCGADKKAGLDFIDAIKPDTEKNLNEEKRYPLVDARQFVANVYPEPKFIMFPIFSERSANQIFGGYESGKTVFGLAAAMHMGSKADFVDFECKKAVPTAYVEGELPAAKIRERFDSILQGMNERGIKFNYDWFHILTKDDLAMHGFKYGFSPIAVSRNLSVKDAEDYGRKGREFISNWIRDIEKKLGQPPFFFLDNMTALADIDENRAQDWTPFIQWITTWKNKGFANCFMHHSNKQSKGKGSSGSTAKERLLDTSMAFEKLDAKHRFDMSGNKNLQCKVGFDKARDFGGSVHDQDFILTMTEEGKWERYPYLDKYDFAIIKLDKRGLSIKDIIESLKDEKGISKQTIYKKHKRLRDLSIIKNEK
jgi:hypothetical protein|tara:strand:+ start:792 stop:2675 length:1884 start_codon:yes stop_codon:yes gene_type:complete